MPNVYVTVSNVETKLGTQLQELLGVADGADVSANARLLQAIDVTNSQIDSYLRGTVELPMATVPAELVSHGVALAVWEILQARREVITELDRSNRTDAIGYLRDIARDTARLSVDASGSTPPNAATSVRIGSGSNLRDSMTSPSWVDNY